MSHIARVELLAEYRPVLARLLEEARQSLPDEVLVGYVAKVLEPNGFMLAVGLQHRYGEPDPEEIVRRALQCELTAPPVLAGIVPRDAFAELLSMLTPSLSELAAFFGDLGERRAPGAPLRVLVAAGRDVDVLSVPTLAG